jgi:phage terminase small subunit
MSSKASTPRAGKGAKSPPERESKGGEGQTLTAKEEEFVRQYMVDLNATKAAVRAGYSARSARQIGSENLSKPYISKEISRALEERCGVTVARVVDELAKIGFSDIREVVSWRPGIVAQPVDEKSDITAKVLQTRVLVKDSSEIDDDAARAIAQVSQGAQGVLRIKMHDKTAALEKLARALGMFRDRHEHTGANGQPLPAGGGGVVIIHSSALRASSAAGAGIPDAGHRGAVRRSSGRRKKRIPKGWKSFP